jgi:archaeal flagellar protein FlaJ
MNKRLEYLKKNAIRGAIGSLIAAIILFNTNIFIFAIFPLLIFIGVAAISYTARIKSYEQNLFVFLEDLKDLLRGGMNIVTAMEVVCENEYGKLNKELERIAAQIKIGISFDQALVNVFKDIDSPMFAKVAQVISESTKYGGNLIKIFSSVATYVKTVNEMTEERKSKAFSTVFSSYFMFFVFIAIILIIQIVFLPMLTSADIMGATPGGEGSTESMEDINFNTYFLYLLVIQGGFAGPIIGKISEGSAMAGLKHSIILLSVSVPLYVVVSILFIL